MLNQSIERGQKVGAYGFVDKNIDPKQLISILKKWILEKVF